MYVHLSTLECNMFREQMFHILRNVVSLFAAELPHLVRKETHSGREQSVTAVVPYKDINRSTANEVGMHGLPSPKPCEC